MIRRIVRSAMRRMRTGMHRLGTAVGGRRRRARDPRLHDDRPRDAAVRRTLRGLALSNRLGRRRVTDPGTPVVVVMTTYRARIGTTHLALESIARGSVLPRRLVLVLDESEIARGVPGTLRRLQRRGLEIVSVADGLGVHSKFWALTSAVPPLEVPLVISDDDQLYPREWLATLLRTAADHPRAIVANRAHRMSVADGALTPYRTWLPYEGGGRPSHAAFATGVSGALLPPHVIDALRDAGMGFLTVTPSADDVWINGVANANGIRVVATTGLDRDFPFLPGTQSVGLYLHNVHDDANDRQLRAMFDAAAIERVRLDSEGAATTN